MDKFGGEGGWLRITILVGVFYLAIGLVSGALAGTAASSQMRFFWRLSAFVLSGIVFGCQITYEHFQGPPQASGLAGRVSLSVAFGAFLLALAANIHDLVSPSGYRPRMLIALVAWPLLTAVPAFLVAFIAAFLLARLPIKPLAE